MNHLAVKEKVEAQIIVDSCGLDATFVGAAPHQHMQRIAAARHVVLEGRARLLTATDLTLFDAIFGVTRDVVAGVLSYATTEEERKKVFLATHFSAKYRDQDIPDPYYYGQQSSFEAVWEVIEDAVRGIYRHFVAPKVVKH